MNKTHLYTEHLKLNAIMTPFSGWEMPVRYKSLKEEVLAVRNKVGIFDVSHMGEFFIQGPDAAKFADFVLTNNIKDADNFQAIYSPMCNQQGGIIDDLICYKFSTEKILLCVNAANISKDYEWLQSVIDNFDCKLTDHSQNYSLIAVQGPEAYGMLKEAFCFIDIPKFSFYCNEDGSIIARTGYTGEDGFEIFAQAPVIGQMWSRLIQLGATPCGLGARDVLRTEACYPLYGNELTDQHTPLESGLKWTVKNEKEDFIGKKALESLSPQYQLIKLSLTKPIPRTGHEIIQDDHIIGKVTSGTMSVTLNKPIAVARVKRSLFNSEKPIFINIRNKNYPAELTKKPFIFRGSK